MEMEEEAVIPSILVVSSLAVCVLGSWLHSRTFHLLVLAATSLVLIVGGWIANSPLPILCSFGIEIGCCLFDFVSGAVGTPDVFMHHVSTPIAIGFSLLRPEISLWSLALLNFTVSLSNIVSSLCKLVYLKNRTAKNRCLAVTIGAAILGRIFIPGFIVVGILTDLYRTEDRPGWTRLYVTSLLMLLYLNVQLVVTYCAKLGPVGYRKEERMVSLYS